MEEEEDNETEMSRLSIQVYNRQRCSSSFCDKFFWMSGYQMYTKMTFGAYPTLMLN